MSTIEIETVAESLIIKSNTKVKTYDFLTFCLGHQSSDLHVIFDFFKCLATSYNRDIFSA
jgi:hypothetical protein